MDWSRAKTILIICLFAVNIFLFGTYMVKENENREEKSRLREEVCKVLDMQGITIKEENIPDDTIEIRHATIKLREDLASVASAILGEVTETSGQNNVVYSGERGNIMFLNDSFSLVYESGTEIKSEEEAKLLAREITAKLGFSTEGAAFEVSASDGGYVVKIPQVFSGMRIFGSELELKISASGSVLGNGGFIGFGKLLRAEGESLEISALLLELADLINEKGKEKTNISGIQYGYSVKRRTAGAVYLVPTMKAETSSGVFLINMEDGRLIDEDTN